MKPRLMNLLVCPLCTGELDLTETKRDGEEIIAGQLHCSACARTYPIRDGVPRLLPPELSSEKEKTAKAFGWQWREFVEMHPEYEEQFLDWIYPIEPEFFRGKVVMDAGCGIGRHAYYAARYGTTEVVGMDLSEAVDTAYENTGTLPNMHIVQGDIYHPPFRRGSSAGEFDFIYSIGVLHHLPDPRAGFQSILRCVKPGGAIFAWVYGRENNALVHGFINPLRKNVTSKLPPPVLPVIAWPMAVAMQGLLKGVYRPAHGTRMFKALPSHDYLYSISGFNFRRNYNIVFDHLVAPVAFYLRREEFEAWFDSNGLADKRISWRNQNSWRGFGRVADSGSSSLGSDSRRAGESEAHQSPELKA